MGMIASQTAAQTASYVENVSFDDVIMAGFYLTSSTY